MSGYQETAMEKPPIEIGYPPASRPPPHEIREANRGIHRSGQVLDDAHGEGTRVTRFQETFKHAAATVGNSVQDRADEVIAYTRREPATALTMAAAVGVLVGLAMAIGGFSGKGWLAPRHRKPNRIARATRRTSAGFQRQDK